MNDPIVNRYADLAVSTFDRAKRKAYYQIEEQRIHQVVPAQFFYWENEYTAANSDLKNFKPAAFIQDTWNCWEWSDIRPMLAIRTNVDELATLLFEPAREGVLSWNTFSDAGLLEFRLLRGAFSGDSMDGARRVVGGRPNVVQSFA